MWEAMRIGTATRSTHVPTLPMKCTGNGPYPYCARRSISNPMTKSRQQIMIMSHHGTICTIASAMAEQMMRSLSAIGSSICPRTDTWLNLRATYPSSPSEAAESAMTMSDVMSWLVAMRYPMIGMEMILMKLMRFGTVQIMRRAGGLKRVSSCVF